MTLQEYIWGQGLLMTDVKADKKGRLFILVEGKEEDDGYFYKEVGIPEEYQTLGNLEEIRKQNE
jgi:hypothetical protein